MTKMVVSAVRRLPSKTQSLTINWIYMNLTEHKKHLVLVLHSMHFFILLKENSVKNECKIEF